MNLLWPLFSSVLVTDLWMLSSFDELCLIHRDQREEL